MAKHPLDPYPVVAESLTFWLDKYLIYKAITLSNARADKKALDAAILRTKRLLASPAPPPLSEIKAAAKAISKAGVAVYPQFYPAYSFVEWLSRNGDFKKIEEIDEETVLEFLTVATSSKADATKVNYKNALINFFGYISRQNAEKHLLDIDIKHWQRSAKNGANRLPEHLNEEELERFFKVLSEHDFTGPRTSEKTAEYKRALYALFLKFLYLTGARVGEAVAVRLKDLIIHDEIGAMSVVIRKGKGNKERIVSIPYSCENESQWCIEEDYRTYMALRRCSDRTLLFCDEKGNPLYQRKIDLVIKEIMAEAGLKKKKMGAHLFRHSNASFIYRQTGDILMVKERLGHESVRVTERYTHLSDEDVLRSVEVFTENKEDKT